MSVDPTKARKALSDQERQALDDLAILPQLRMERRRRPLYFDGRFLAARDLTREQDYFLARQADLGRAGGFGVVSGLQVVDAPNQPGQITIQPGHGITPSGELVVVDDPLTFDPGRVRISETIRVRVGVTRVREPASRVRSGLYVLALRPIEYEAGPVAQYPTTLGGERRTHNGDIVEATAVTLIPYPDFGDPTELRFRRAHAAKEIFVDGVAPINPGTLADALPIAMLALDARGNLVWIDPHLVRREIGAEAGDILGVSGAPLALREAFMLQFDAHLRSVLKATHGAIVASQHFLALPPAGPMPRSAIDRQNFTQRFFPAEVDVDMSVVPSDELGALLEEARLLPPIDLTDSEALKGTSVLVLVPVDRKDLNSARARLVEIRRKFPTAAPNLLARQRPQERLLALAQVRQGLIPTVPAAHADDLVWRSLLDLNYGDHLVWYVRRRSLSPKPSLVAEVAGRPPYALTRLRLDLDAYGVTDDDIKRIPADLWDTARPLLDGLPPLFKAAALVELARASHPTSPDDARAWVESVIRRHAEPPGADQLLQLFQARTGLRLRPSTPVLVRSGLALELAAALAALDDKALTEWKTELDKRERETIERHPAAPFEHETALRQGLLAAFSHPRRG